MSSASASMNVTTTSSGGNVTTGDSASGAVATPIVVPSLWKIGRFCLVATGISLCGPLLGLIDTASVGLLCGTTQQAALSPAVALVDYASILIYFVFAATTHLMAASSNNDEEETTRARQRQDLLACLQLATWVGMGLGLLMGVASPVLLRWFMGRTFGSDAAVFAAALAYVRVRAWGVPAGLWMGTAQSACLGWQNVVAPLGALWVAATVNVLGDVVLVRLCRSAKGAAAATVLSQYAAVAALHCWFRGAPAKTKHGSSEEGGEEEDEETTTKEKKHREEEEEEEIEQSSHWQDKKKGNTTTHRQPQEEYQQRAGQRQQQEQQRALQIGNTATRRKRKHVGMSTRGILAPSSLSSSVSCWWRPPPRPFVMTHFVPYILPVTTSSVGRLAAYVAMNHVVSSTLGTTAMAAQQVLLSLFYCLTPWADSLSHAAQSMIPRLLLQDKNNNDEEEEKPTELALKTLASSARQEEEEQQRHLLRQATWNFWKMASLLGMVLGGAAACTPLVSGFFSRDVHVIAKANAMTPLLTTIMAMYGIFCASEGVLLGQQDLTFFGRIYAVFIVLAPCLWLPLKRAKSSPSLLRVWWMFGTYHLVRTCIFVSRLWWLTIRRKTGHCPSITKPTRAAVLEGE